MDTARVSAYAKLNLTLDITGREGGYHLLDSLVLTVALCDRVVAKRRKDGLCSVRMRGMGSESIPPEENNALAAAEAFSARFQTGGCDLTVFKNIPVGAGLGGSSADAAGAILAMAKLYGVRDRAALFALAAELGSDVSFQLAGGFARMRGRGEILERFRAAPKLFFLLLCPKEKILSSACYAEYDRQKKSFPPRTDRALEALKSGGAVWAAPLFGNHLTEAAQSLEPAARRALLALKEFSPLGAAMTGSGSAAYAVFETMELAEWAKSRYRGDFRAIAVQSVDPAKLKTWKNPYRLGEDEGE